MVAGTPHLICAVPEHRAKALGQALGLQARMLDAGKRALKVEAKLLGGLRSAPSSPRASGLEGMQAGGHHPMSACAGLAGDSVA